MSREFTKNEEELPTTELPEEYQYIKACEFDGMIIYDRTADAVSTVPVVCSRAAMPPLFQLSVTDSRRQVKTGE
jgi:hypothetical protein